MQRLGCRAALWFMRNLALGQKTQQSWSLPEDCCWPLPGCWGKGSRHNTDYLLELRVIIKHHIPLEDLTSSQTVPGGEQKMALALLVVRRSMWTWAEAEISENCPSVQVQSALLQGYHAASGRWSPTYGTQKSLLLVLACKGPAPPPGRRWVMVPGPHTEICLAAISSSCFLVRSPHFFVLSAQHVLW